MTTFDKVKQAIIDALQCEEGLIQQDTVISEGLGVDSLGMMELIMELEDQFGFKIDNEKVKDIVTVNDIVALVDSNVSAS